MSRALFCLGKNQKLKMENQTRPKILEVQSNKIRRFGDRKARILPALYDTQLTLEV